MEYAEPLDVALRIAHTLQRLGIPRATQDIDIIADLGRHHVPLLVNALQSQFYIDAEMVAGAIRRRSTVNYLDLERPAW